MTYAMREEIFSKEYLSIEDIQELLGMSYDDAARTIRNIKRRTDRLGIRGKLHVQDYLWAIILSIQFLLLKRNQIINVVV